MGLLGSIVLIESDDFSAEGPSAAREIASGRRSILTPGSWLSDSVTLLSLNPQSMIATRAAYS